MASSRFSTQLPLVIGHRGASGHAVENSVRAFRLAADRTGETHCDGVELDIHATRDGELVVHHDFVLGSGLEIARADAAAVRQDRLRDESPLLTLAEALELLADQEVFIEAKTLPREVITRLVAVIRDAPRCRCHVHAFDHRIIRLLHETHRELSLGVLSRSYPIDATRQVRDAGATALWQEAYLIDEEMVARCDGEGIDLFAWTVNDEAEACRLAAMGVTGICGDFPGRLRRAQSSRKGE